MPTQTSTNYEEGQAFEQNEAFLTSFMEGRYVKTHDRDYIWHTVDRYDLKARLRSHGLDSKAIWVLAVLQRPASAARLSERKPHIFEVFHAKARCFTVPTL